MKVVFSSLILCLVWITPVGAQTKTDRDRAELVGPVKSVEAYLIDFFMKNGSTVEGKRRPWHSTSYNTEGNISERVSYDPTGAITDRYKHTFDAKGRSTGYEEYSAFMHKSLTIPRRHVYKLDEEGRRVEYILFESDETVGTRFVYKYDPKGNLIEDQWYPHTGKLGSKRVNVFDERGNQTSQTNYPGDGALSSKFISKFDGHGNRTEWLQYRGDTLRYKITYRYDSKGRILEQETFEFNGIPGMSPSHAPEPGKVVYSYDDEKRTKEVATYELNGRLEGKVAYTYDERGNVIERTMFNGDGLLKDLEMRLYDNINKPGSALRGTLSDRSLMKIEYDSHGNWTKKTRFIQSEEGLQSQASSAELRVITYY